MATLGLERIPRPRGRGTATFPSPPDWGSTSPGRSPPFACRWIQPPPTSGQAALRRDARSSTDTRPSSATETRPHPLLARSGRDTRRPLSKDRGRRAFAQMSGVVVVLLCRFEHHGLTATLVLASRFCAEIDMPSPPSVLLHACCVLPQLTPVHTRPAAVKFHSSMPPCCRAPWPSTCFSRSCPELGPARRCRRWSAVHDFRMNEADVSRLPVIALAFADP
jgi:hypothetical protein